ncbi:MAG: S24 family peptidase [Terrimicrobiaceae bacterium]|nr:S24 family peptidase [Terrimicrobiaceae bacterium]
MSSLWADGAAGAGLPSLAAVAADRSAPLPPGATARFALAFHTVPIAGEISAGFGDPVESAGLGSIPVRLDALGIKSTPRTFALRVRGDSMTGAQIDDGDLVIVEAREPKSGDVVAALIDGETTLKRLVVEAGQPYLKAENPKYPDRIPLRELTIQGVVRALIRAGGPPRPVR